MTLSLNIQNDRVSGFTSTSASDLVKKQVILTYSSRRKVLYVYNPSYNVTTITAITQEYRPFSKYADIYYKAHFYINSKPELFDDYWSIS